MCGDDYETALQTSGWRRARKTYPCCACPEGIKAGELYRYHKTLYEDRWDLYRHCARCAAICIALWKAGAGAIDLELDCGELWDWNFPPDPEVEQLAFLSRDEAQKLAFAAREAGFP